MRAYKIEQFNHRTIPDGGTEILSVKDKSVTEIDIPTGITHVGEGAFRDCARLVTIYIPQTVTFIGPHAFDGCDALCDVRYEGDKASWKNIDVEAGNQVFSTIFMTFESEPLNKGQEDEEPSKTAVTASTNKALSPVFKFLRSKLFLCVVLPALLGVILVTSALLFASSERPYNKYQDDGFVCTIKGSTVTLIDYTGTAFEVVIPVGIDVIGQNAFENCEHIKSVTIPDSVTVIGISAFRRCTNLTSIAIPNSVTSINLRAFDECPSLTDVYYIGNKNQWKALRENIATIKNDALLDANIRYSDNDSSENTDGPDIYDLARHGIIVEKQGDDYVLTNYMGDATTVVIPGGITKIMGGAFQLCTWVTGVTIPDSVTSIGGTAFGNCTSLKSITIPDSVTSIGIEAFRGCSALTKVTIGNGVTSIGDDAFAHCNALTSVTIPDNVTSIGDDAFAHCNALTSVTIPDNVTSIGAGAFRNCSALTEITIGNGVTSIGELAFSFNSSLISVTIPNSVTSIGEYAFNKCSKLTSVTIGNGVTSISDYTFDFCSLLTIVTISDSVMSIGEGAFRYCSALTDVYYTGTEEQWNTLKESIASDNDKLYSATIQIHYNYSEE